MSPKRRHSGNEQQDASFEQQEGERSRVTGALHFTTVSALLPQGTSAIEAGKASVIDLAGVTGSDSSGLALLIEWLSVAKSTGKPLQYDNMPSQLHQLARLSEVEDLVATSRKTAAPL